MTKYRDSKWPIGTQLTITVAPEERGVYDDDLNPIVKGIWEWRASAVVVEHALVDDRRAGREMSTPDEACQEAFEDAGSDRTWFAVRVTGVLSEKPTWEEGPTDEYLEHLVARCDGLECVFVYPEGLYLYTGEFTMELKIEPASSREEVHHD